MLDRSLLYLFLIVSVITLGVPFLLSYAVKVVFRCSILSGFYFSVLTIFALLCTRDKPFTFLPSTLDGWFLYSNYFQNTYLLWRFDPLLSLAQLLFAATHETRFICFMALTWYGTYRFMATIGVPIKADRHEPHTPPLTIKSFLATIPVSILAVDGIALAAFAWIPLLSALLREDAAAIISELLRKKKRKRKPQSLFERFRRLAPISVLSIFAAQSANHFAIITAGCILLLSWFSVSSETPSGVGQCDTKSKIRYAVVTLLPALCITLMLPMAPFPEYPFMSHVVPDDGLPGIVRPLIGPDYPLAVVNANLCRTVYGSLTITIVVSALWALVCAQQLFVAKYNRFIFIGAILFILVSLDTQLPVAWSHITPLSSLSRLLPWGTSIYLPSFCLGVGVWCFSLGLIQVAAPSLRIGELFALGVLLLSTYVYTGTKSITPVPLHDDIHIASPSAYVFRYIYESIPPLASSGRASLEEIITKNVITGFRKVTRHSLNDLGARVEFFITKGESYLGVPLDTQTPSPQQPLMTWNWRRGRQEGNEVVRITFPEALEIAGIELSPGTFSTDFPRGITVAGGPCDEHDSRTLIRQFKSWQGSIERTSTEYPYFAGQDSVRIDLPELPTYRCLYLHQTGTTSYDWTIADVAFYTR